MVCMGIFFSPETLFELSLLFDTFSCSNLIEYRKQASKVPLISVGDVDSQKEDGHEDADGGSRRQDWVDGDIDVGMLD